MEAFDLDQHYKRARNAVTEEQMAELRNEFDSYHDSLSESDRKLFVLRLSEHAREEIIRTKALIEFVKEVMGMEQETV